MIKEIDLRNYKFCRTNKECTKDLKEISERISKQLANRHSLYVQGINNLTGSTKNIFFKKAAQKKGSFINQAFYYLHLTKNILGFSKNDFPEFVSDCEPRVTKSGSTIIQLHQHIRGIPVFQMIRTVTFGANGKIRNIKGNNINIGPITETKPTLSVKDSLRIVIRFFSIQNNKNVNAEDSVYKQLEDFSLDVSHFKPKIVSSFNMPSKPTILDGGALDSPIKANLAYFYQVPSIRLCWKFSVTIPSLFCQYLFFVSTDSISTGEVLYCKKTSNDVEARGAVYTHNPRETPRRLVDFPKDWVESNYTLGNLTSAFLGTGNTTFEGIMKNDILTFNPSDSTGDDQKILNIFYFCNYMHNFFLHLGFDEKAGNFQRDNFTDISNGEGDEVIARAHPGKIPSLANMWTPPDGESPLMNMGMHDTSSRHTALDSDIVFHEYVHGVTNRLVGGRFDDEALTEPQSAAQGEGWSDYFALTIQNYDKDTEKVVIGDWVTGNPKGRRMYNYDEGFPDNFGKLGSGRYDGRSLHAIGEIWCATLMQMNRNIGKALGSTKKGHEMGWQLVVDGLKLSTTNPSFLDSRDYMLEALDEFEFVNLITSNEYRLILRAVWEAFAKFGMGPNAHSSGARLHSVGPDFELPMGLQL